MCGAHLMQIRVDTADFFTLGDAKGEIRIHRVEFLRLVLSFVVVVSLSRLVESDLGRLLWDRV